jgi:hypothetical protein
VVGDVHEVSLLVDELLDLRLGEPSALARGELDPTPAMHGVMQGLSPLLVRLRDQGRQSRACQQRHQTQKNTHPQLYALIFLCARKSWLSISLLGIFCQFFVPKNLGPT